MNDIRRTENRGNEGDLDGVIEPLASYICAAEQPQAALKSVLAALFREVRQTNAAARIRVTALVSAAATHPSGVAAPRESRIALPA